MLTFNPSIQTTKSGSAKANADSLHRTLPSADKLATSPAHRPLADTCGSLHLTESHGLHRPAANLEEECADFLFYGHYHGFGDTAEELSYGGAALRHAQDLSSSARLHLGS